MPNEENGSHTTSAAWDRLPVAKIIATGHSFEIPNGGFVAMRADFVQKHPDIAKARRILPIM